MMFRGIWWHFSLFSLSYCLRIKADRLIEQFSEDTSTLIKFFTRWNPGNELKGLLTLIYVKSLVFLRFPSRLNCYTCSTDLVVNDRFKYWEL